MAIKRRSKIGFCLLAIGLFGVSTTGSCFGEEVGARDASAERSASPARSSGAAAAAASKPESRSAPQANGGDGKAAIGEGAPAASPAAANSPAPSGVNLDGIDTSITVVPRRLANGRPKIGNVKVVKIAPRNLLAPRTSASGRSQTIVRNAIGITVAHLGGSERRIGAHHDSLIVVHGANAVAAVAGSTPGRLGKVEGPIDRSIAHANPVIKPFVLNRATINGTTLNHRGVGPSNVGGPARPIAGINGTAIRPAH